MINLMAGVQLYDYQLEAVQKMWLGCILCDGGGKRKNSRTGLAFYYQMCAGRYGKASEVWVEDAKITGSVMEVIEYV